MWHYFMFTLTVLVAQAKGGTESRFNAATSDAQLNNEPQQQLQVNLNAWQPLTGHNNWLILQATAATAVQHQKKQQQHLPVSYYAYNHRYQHTAETASNVAAADGNYKQVRTSLNESPSYVWAIRQSLPLPVVQDVDAETRAEVRQTDNYADLAEAADDPVDGLAKSTATALHINNYLLAFERAVLKVRNFCDTVRELISMESEPDEQQQEFSQEQPVPLDSTPSNLLGSGISATTSKEIQGRHSRLTESYEGRKLKKLKKKIQKLMLPLLIAYKLKFLTLIPVLIGGLTLLVGTTGLAGFFFALFTAVMSLKSSTGAGHSTKAILLKKI